MHYINKMAAKSRKLLIVGLGNPEPEYSLTRHNAGFMATNVLAGSDAKWKKERHYLIAEAGRLAFIKPQTFMNLSGQAVLAAMAKYRAGLENIIVIHDDIDLKPGTIKTKIGGGNAGHNGLRSISEMCGNDYRRIRIGIGRPGNKEIEISDWVLGRFPQAELETISAAIDAVKVLLAALTAD